MRSPIHIKPSSLSIIAIVWDKSITDPHKNRWKPFICFSMSWGAHCEVKAPSTNKNDLLIFSLPDLCHKQLQRTPGHQAIVNVRRKLLSMWHTINSLLFRKDIPSFTLRVIQVALSFFLKNYSLYFENDFITGLTLFGKYIKHEPFYDFKQSERMNQ